MKKSIKKGFTLVELLVVIAIIAILSIVGIVGYVSFTNRARVSNDTTIVTELNRVLQAEHVNKKPSTMQDVVDEIFDAGFDLTKLTPTAAKHHIVYDFEGDRFYLLNESHLIVGGEKDGQPLTGNKWDHWKVIQSYAEASDAEFSHYLGKMNPVNTAEILNVTTGIDVGSNTVAQINYTGGSVGKEVVIRTNGGQLNIGTSEADAAGKITHYGTLDEAIVYTTSNSFHTHGKITSMDLKTGLAVAEDKGYVALVKAAEGTTVEEKDTGVFYIPADATTETINAEVAATIGYTVTTEGTTASVAKQEKIASTDYEIANKNDLIAFRDAWNRGNLPAGTTYKIVNDIDMSDYLWLEAIGSSDKPFSGTILGQNHSIIGLTNGGSRTEVGNKNITSGKEGDGFALIGRATGNLTVSNLTLKQLSVNLNNGLGVAGLVSWPTGECNWTFTNITTTGFLYGKEKVAGIVGQGVGYGSATGSMTFINCVNEADIRATADRAGGILGAAGASTMTFTKCINKGRIEAGSYGAGICGNLNCAAGKSSGEVTGPSYIATNCSNEGEIVASRAFSLFWDNYSSGNNISILQSHTNCLGDWCGTAYASKEAYWRAVDKYSSYPMYSLAGIAYEMTQDETDSLLLTYEVAGCTYKFASWEAVKTRRAAASDTGLVTLLKDYDFTGNNVEAGNFSQGMKIDLNGHTLDLGGPTGFSNNQLYSGNGIEFITSNGTIEGTMITVINEDKSAETRKITINGETVNYKDIVDGGNYTIGGVTFTATKSANTGDAGSNSTYWTFAF